MKDEEMTGQSSWRSLRTVMVVTVHVAAVAYLFRWMVSPDNLAGSIVWVPATISVAVFLSWPIGRAIGRAFDPGELPVDRTCPTCGRREVRPLLRPGGDLFQPASVYRCAACWTTFRPEPDGRYRVLPLEPGGPVDPSGITFPADPVEPGEIVFLDEPAGGP